MNLNEFLEWLSLAFGEDKKSLRQHSHWARLLDASVDRSCVLYDAFEVSMNSSKSSSYFQLTHLHIYPKLLPEDALRRVQERKIAAARQILEDICIPSGESWPLDKAYRVLETFRSWNSIPSVSLFSIEFDMANAKAAKITLYTGMKSREQLEALRRILSPDHGPEVSGQMADRFDCLGVDLWPDGRTGLKIYELHPPDRLRTFSFQHAVKALDSLGRLFPARHLILLRKIDPDGTIAPPTKILFRMQQGVTCEYLQSLEYFQMYGRFLSEIKNVLSGQKIYYICFNSAGELEVFYRKGQAPWEKTNASDGSRKTVEKAIRASLS